MSDAQSYRRLIAQAWGGMLALLLTMLMVDTLQHAMAGQYAELSAVLAHDPGRAGLAVLVGLICSNTLVQLLVQGGRAAPRPRGRFRCQRALRPLLCRAPGRALGPR